MDKVQRKAVDELVADMEGLQQLATWQLALVREVMAKIACLDALPDGVPGARPSRRRGKRARKT